MSTEGPKAVHPVASKADLEEKIASAGDKLVVIDFFATWCNPCKRVAPILEEIALKNLDKMLVLKVDVDEVEELVGQYNIEVMPTFVFKRRGKEIDTLVGSNEKKLAELISKYTS